MKKLMVLALVLAMVVLSACSATRAPSGQVPSSGSKSGAMPGPAPTPGMTDYSTSSETRMVVRSGDMSLVVKDVLETRDKVGQLAVRLTGYVVSSYLWPGTRYVGPGFHPRTG